MMNYDIIQMADIKAKRVPMKTSKARPAVINLLKEKKDYAISIQYICDATGYCYSTVLGVLKELIFKRKVKREMLKGQKKHFFSWTEED